MNDMVSRYDASFVTGIFGGSFDPVHNGHLSLAGELLDTGVVERIIFMPAARAPHKLEDSVVSAADRLQMLTLATQDEPQMAVSSFEVDRGGVSYTHDTLTCFSQHFGPNLRMIIGMDSLRDLHKWYKSDELVRLCPFITYCRPGFPAPDRAVLVEQFGEPSANRLLEGIVEADLFDISSTEVRQQIKQGKLAESLIPEAVLTYIKERNLYK